MELPAEKLSLMKQILDIDDDKLISALLDLLEPKKKEDELTDSQHKEILLGIKQLDEGKRASFKYEIRNLKSVIRHPSSDIQHPTP